MHSLYSQGSSSTLLSKLVNPLGVNTGGASGIVEQTNKIPATTPNSGGTDNPTGLLGKVVPKFNALIRGSGASQQKPTQQVEEAKKDGGATIIPP